MKSPPGTIPVLWFAAACGGPATLVSAPGGSCLGGAALGPSVIAYEEANLTSQVVAGRYPPPFAILTIPTSGGSPTTLVASEDFPILIGLDATNLYYLSEAGDLAASVSVKAVPLAGGRPFTLAADAFSGNAGRDLPYVDAAAVDDKYAYWVDGQLHGLESLALDGGAPQTLLTPVDVNPGALLARSGELFWASAGVTDAGALRSIPAVGGSVTPLAILPSGDDPRLAADDFFWYVSLNLVGGGTVIGRVPLGGGNFSIIANGLPPLTAIRVDPKASEFVYWSSPLVETAAIGRTRISDGQVVSLASVYISSDPETEFSWFPTLLGVDGVELYGQWNCALARVAEQ